MMDDSGAPYLVQPFSRRRGEMNREAAFKRSFRQRKTMRDKKSSVVDDEQKSRRFPPRRRIGRSYADRALSDSSHD